MAKAKGYQATLQSNATELKVLRAASRSVSSTTQKVEDQIRLAEKKKELQLDAARERLNMKLDMNDEEVKRKMLREDDRANQKTGGAIKDYMTNNSQWGLKSAARLAWKRKDNDRNQDNYELWWRWQ